MVYELGFLLGFGECACVVSRENYESVWWLPTRHTMAHMPSTCLKGVTVPCHDFEAYARTMVVLEPLGWESQAACQSISQSVTQSVSQSAADTVAATCGG